MSSLERILPAGDRLVPSASTGTGVAKRHEEEWSGETRSGGRVQVDAEDKPTRVAIDETQRAGKPGG
jgi:hypothetical protein